MRAALESNGSTLNTTTVLAKAEPFFMPGHVAKAKTRRRERQMKVNVVLRAGKPEGEVGCHIIVVPILKLNLQFPELQLPILPGPVTPGITARPAAAENRRDKWFLCAAGRARATVLPGKGGHTTHAHHVRCPGVSEQAKTFCNVSLMR